MASLVNMVSDFAGFQYTPKFKSYTTPPTPTTSGTTTPVRKMSEPAAGNAGGGNGERRHSVIITVGVNQSTKFPELQRQRITEEKLN